MDYFYLNGEMTILTELMKVSCVNFEFILY